jgi:hypothetical protein
VQDNRTLRLNYMYPIEVQTVWPPGAAAGLGFV